MGQFDFLRREIRAGRMKGNDRLYSSAPEVYTDEESQFIAAVEAYKAMNNRPYPRLTEYLWILKKLGFTRPPNAKT